MYLIDDELSYLDTSENESNQASVMNQLKRRNEELEETIHEKKRILPEGVDNVLKDYLKNIESVDKNEQQSHEITSVLKKKKKPIKQLLKFPLFTAIVGIFFVVVISIFCYSFFQGLSFNFGSGLFAGIP